MKLGFIKMENYCTSKDIVKKVKRQPTEQKKIFAIPYLIRGQCPDYTKDPYHPTEEDRHPNF